MRNESIYVEEVVKRIAQLKGDNVEVVKMAMVSNAMRVFDIR